jgi:hypothetical protein
MYHKTKNFDMEFDFLHLDVISDPEDLIDKIDSTHKPVGVVIHMSNIFAYEGTASLMPLRYRIEQENKLIKSIQKSMPICVLDFDQRAAEGIVSWKPTTGLAKDLELTDWNSISLPSWHRP